ncbi:MAG: hypothetical protein CMN32_04490 [Saprospirales bacterium]|nr:hypothetical protein [Saprospirales bacterium]
MIDDFALFESMSVRTGKCLLWSSSCFMAGKSKKKKKRVKQQSEGVSFLLIACLLTKVTSAFFINFTFAVRLANGPIVQGIE